MKRFRAAVPPAKVNKKRETRKAKGIANQTTPDTVKQYGLSDEIPCKENPKRNRPPPIHKLKAKEKIWLRNINREQCRQSGTAVAILLPTLRPKNVAKIFFFTDIGAKCACIATIISTPLHGIMLPLLPSAPPVSPISTL